MVDGASAPGQAPPLIKYLPNVGGTVGSCTRAEVRNSHADKEAGALMATIESYLLPRKDNDGNPLKPETRYMVRYRTPQQTQTKKRGFTTKRAAEAFANTVE